MVYYQKRCLICTISFFLWNIDTSRSLFISKEWCHYPISHDLNNIIQPFKERALKKRLKKTGLVPARGAFLTCKIVDFTISVESTKAQLETFSL